MSVRDVVQAAAGALGGGATYVEDVFSTYLYTGTGSTQVIENGIALGDTNAGPCVPFSGNQYLSRTSDFTGNSDGSTFTLSFWAFVTNSYNTIFRSNSGRVEVLIQPNNVQFDFKNTSGTSIWRGNSNSGTVKAYQWNHILISVDAGSNAKIYINDVSSGISYDANTSGTFDFTDTSWGIGAYADGSLKMAGKLTEFFFDKTYRNLGTVANRRLFITADGEPATGLASLNPLIYLPLNDTVSVGTNEGTGGDFVPINGLSSSETGGPYTEAGYGQGGLVWIKSRSAATDNQLFDTERGVTKELISNSSAAETTDTDTLTAFNADGFSLGADSNVNTNAATYTSWTFRKAPKFFDVVTYTGNGVDGRTVSHNLESEPGCIIVKRTDSAAGWIVYHRSSGAGKYLRLDGTGAEVTSTAAWNNTSPTSTVFSVGTNSGIFTGTNASGSTYVAYLFAHDAGGFGDDGTENVISCGSFTTDGSGNATVDLGYEPQWVMLKTSSDSSSGWLIEDSMRGLTVGVSGGDKYLEANNANAEAGTNNIELTATGFNHTAIFASKTFIYIAIRRGPMKTPESGTEVFSALARTGTGAAVTTSATFAPDLMIVTDRAKSLYNETDVFDRLRANKFLVTTGTQLESTRTQFLGFDAMTGVRLDADTSGFINFSSKNYIDWYFKRAPGFFDVVAYTGTGNGSAGQYLSLSHNLQATPEMMIVKRRSPSGTSWHVYHSALGNTKFCTLNGTAGASTATAAWNDTSPTSSQFTVGSYVAVNYTGYTYIAYLFATLDGVSKVGSYTGTAANLDVDCGFSAGARFILIKRTDSTGDWYVWDSERGITAGNDPYLLLNSTAAEVTSTDYIDPLASGFTVTSSAPAALNASGGTYIFLAIA